MFLPMKLSREMVAGQINIVGQPMQGVLPTQPDPFQRELVAQGHVVDDRQRRDVRVAVPVLPATIFQALLAARPVGVGLRQKSSHGQLSLRGHNRAARFPVKASGPSLRGGMKNIEKWPPDAGQINSPRGLHHCSDRLPDYDELLGLRPNEFSEVWRIERVPAISG